MARAELHRATKVGSRLRIAGRQCGARRRDGSSLRPRTAGPGQSHV